MELPSAERQAFLQTECADAPDLIAEVNELLAAYTDGEDKLEESPVAVAIAQDTAPMLPVDAIDGYRIERELNRGGQGVVYQAVQLSTKRAVALKVMLGGPFAGAANIRRFEREIELIGRLKHPGIVPVFDSGMAHDKPYFAMEFVNGKRLNDFLVFNPGDPDADVNPADGPRGGSVGLADAAFGDVDFVDIEDVVIQSGPRIDIVNLTETISEGDDLSLSVTLPNVPQNSGVTDVSWSIEGIAVGNLTDTTLALTWDQLALYGVENGPRSYTILVSASRTDGGETITTTRTINLMVLDTPPTIDLTADDSVRVGDTYQIRFNAIDPGVDAVKRWIVEWGDGTVQIFGAGVSSATHTYLTPGSLSLKVRVQDEESDPLDAAFITHPLAVTVDSQHVTPGRYTIAEGESLQLDGEVAGTPASVSWDINGDGTFGDATTLDALLDWDTQLKALGIDGSSHTEIRPVLRATYANGDSVEREGSLSVVNVSPTGTLSTDVPVTGIDEGSVRQTSTACSLPRRTTRLPEML